MLPIVPSANQRVNHSGIASMTCSSMERRRLERTIQECAQWAYSIYTAGVAPLLKHSGMSPACLSMRRREEYPYGIARFLTRKSLGFVGGLPPLVPPSPVGFGRKSAWLP